MCGIAGIYSPGPPLGEPAAIERMAEAIRHRGPDQYGCYTSARMHLASRRLSIIDIEGGRQPVVSDDGSCVIVFNGEIYNYREVRDDLLRRGHRFHTGTDTEVILKAYLEWDSDCLQHFTGMFAFAIWNQMRREAFLARDRMGIKPLYYTHLADGTVLFASEIKSLLAHPLVDASLYPKAVENLLTYGFNIAPHTFFQGIHQVLPGHFLTIGEGGIRVRQYWDIDVQRPLLTLGEEEIAEELFARIRACVRARLVGDVPVSAYLSGGIDSSAVTALYAGLSRTPVRTYSLIFDEAAYDERIHARQVADRYHTDHHELHCRTDDHQVTDLIYYLEEPMMTLLNQPLWLLSRQVHAGGCKVVLTGDGADEIFAGYDYFRLLKAMQFIGRNGGSLRKRILQRILPSVRNPLQASIHYELLSQYPVRHPALPYRFLELTCKPQLLSTALKARICSQPPDPPFFFDPAVVAHRPLLDQALYIEAKMRLLNLTLPLADKMSMANSVEARPVFLDHELVNWVFSIPGHLKLRALSEKYILKKSMQSLLPPAICQRKKQPLLAPADTFLHDHREMVQDLLSVDTIRRKDYFDTAFLSGILQRFFSGQREVAPLLLVTFFIHLWDEVFLN